MVESTEWSLLGMTILRLFEVSALIKRSFANKFIFLVQLTGMIYEEDTDSTVRGSHLFMSAINFQK